MSRTYKGQKAGLTRAINSGNPEKVIRECRRAVNEWSTWRGWPDDWSRWERALQDATGGWKSTHYLENL